MRCHISLGILRFFHDRKKLPARELEELNWVGGRRDASVRHDLDELSALPNFAHGPAHLRLSITDPPDRAEPSREPLRGARVIATAIVGMAAAL